MKVQPDKKHKGMFRVEWPDGSQSTDVYNKTRAREILRREGIEDYIVGRVYNAPNARLEARG